MMLTEPLPLWQIIIPAMAVALVALICLLREMPFLRIVMLGVGGAVVYGILQDQITVRLCPEYFTIAHLPISGISNLSLLGTIWGFLGSWWAGLIAGTALALCAVAGGGPRISAGELIRPLMLTMLLVALFALLAGIAAYLYVGTGKVSPGVPWDYVIPQSQHRVFITVAIVHLTAYVSAAICGLGLCCHTVSRRKNRLRK